MSSTLKFAESLNRLKPGPSGEIPCEDCRIQVAVVSIVKLRGRPDGRSLCGPCAVAYCRALPRGG